MRNIFDKTYIKTKLIEQIKKEQGIFIEENDNLLQVGLNSLTAMKVMIYWRNEGYSVKFSELMKHPYINEWAELLVQSKECVSCRTVESYSNMYEPFEMTDVQYAYWVGRREGQFLGNVGCHGYFEVDTSELDLRRLQRAWEILFEYHPMLRAKFTTDGKQQIMKVPYQTQIGFCDITKEQDKGNCLSTKRKQLSHRLMDIKNGQVIALEVTKVEEGSYRLHFDIDLLVCDVQSFQIILRDLARYYLSEKYPPVKKEWNFAEYIEKRKKNTYVEKEDKEYWTSKLFELPEAPQIPINSEELIKRETFFQRYSYTVPYETTETLRIKAKNNNMTLAELFLAVYGYVISKWSQNKKFLINVPLFNRDNEEGIEEVVADFTNLILVPLDFTQRKSFVEYAMMVKENFRNSIDHSSYSGIKVLRDLKKKRGFSMGAPIVFSCNLGKPLLTKEFKDAFGEISYMISQTPQTLLDFQLFDLEQGVLIVWDAVEKVFPKGVLAEMFELFLGLLEKLSSDEYVWSDTLSILSASQKKRIENITKFQPLIKTPKTLIEEIIKNSKEDPYAIAVVDPIKNEKISYRSLIEKSRRIAGCLKAMGMKKGDNIALITERKIESIMAMLAIQICGGVYIPIRDSQPIERVKIILENVETKWLIINDEDNPRYQCLRTINKIFINKAIRHPESYEGMDAEVDMPAYIIHTSGSTGIPKGVMITHKAVMNTIDTINNQYNISAGDTILGVSEYDFDLSIYDVFGMLSAGGQIVIVPRNIWREPHAWLNIITKFKITVWNSVPAILEMLLLEAEAYGQVMKSIKKVFLSGDWTRLDIPERLNAIAPNSKLVVMGGATEAAIWSNYIDVSLPIPQIWKSIPYGKPLKNQYYRVVDERGEECPDYVKGELRIGGEGVAVEYVGDPKLTQKKFIYEYGRKWYCTGDMGKFWEDDTIEFMGREDNQIKIRGYRVELGEIENLIQKQLFVKQCAVRVNERQTQLIAYLVVDPYPETAFDQSKYIERTKEHLKQYLPEYMIPTGFRFLKQLLITENGKIDRKLLKDMDKELREISFPKTKTEKRIAVIWERLLGRKEIGRNENYFEIGGDSLIATQLVILLQKEFNVEVTLEVVFSNPTIKDLAIYIESGKGVTEEIWKEIDETDKQNLYTPFPLTDVQKAYIIGKNSDYSLGNISTHYYYELDVENINVDKLNKALNKLIIRHPMMRAIISGNNLQQRIQEKVPTVNIKVRDYTDMEQKEVDIQRKELREKMTHMIFENEKWPLFEICISRCRRFNRIHMCFDNVIYDGWSIALFLKEWDYLYQNDIKNLDELTITFRDYVLAVENLKKTERYMADKQYWLKQIKMMYPAPVLPIKYNIDKSRKHRFKHYEFKIETHIWNKIKIIAEKNGVSPTCVLLSVYAEVIARWSEVPRFTLNITQFNRYPLHSQINQLIGDFTSLIMFSVNNSIENSFIERCKLNQAHLWEILNHTLYSGIEVQREFRKQNPDVKENVMPVVFTSGLGISLNERYETLGTITYNMSETSQVWIDNQVAEKNGSLYVFLDVVEDLFPEIVIQQMLECYKNILIKLADDSAWGETNVKLVDLPHIETNDNAEIELEKGQTLLSLFEKSVQKFPDKVAVIIGNKTVTYKELWKVATGISKNIRSIKSNIESGDVVAICMEKGWEYVAIEIGVMMTGAAFLPIAATMPEERRKKILIEAGAIILISKPEKNIEYDLLIENYTTELSRKENCKLKVLPEDLAYVIFTSGTTGNPKGVMITHENVVNTLLDLKQRFQLTEYDKTIAISDFSFDLSIFDIFGMLSYGGSVVIPEANKMQMPTWWIHLIANYQVTIWNSVPKIMEILCEAVQNKADLSSLKYIFLSGDWIPIFLPEKIRTTVPKSNIISLGGATEGSIWSIYYPITEVKKDWNSIPYGRPLGNQKIYILDELYRQCPAYVVGKIFIVGKGVAKGYINNSNMTKEKFVCLDFLNEIGYDTGDYGYSDATGKIIFLGRKDNQVKINGYRIELEEIEKILITKEEIASAVVIPNENKTALKAAIVYKTGKEPLSSNAIKDYLKRHLPTYMIAGVLIPLSELPLTGNGKVDRRKVCTILAEEQYINAYKNEMPQTEEEQYVANIWGKILEHVELSRNENFFTYGGDSLKAIQIVNKINSENAMNISIVDIFNYPTIKEFAELLSEKRMNKKYQEGTL